MAEQPYPMIVPNVTTGAQSAQGLNGVGADSEVAIHSVSAIANVGTELNYFVTGSIVYSILEKQYYSYNGTVWSVISDISTSTNTYTKTQSDLNYAPIGKGVTNGDSHDHLGGDGGTIAYTSLSGTPTLGTASSKDVAPTGDASATQVVLGNDTRLTGARTPTAHASTHVTGGTDVIANVVAAGASGLMTGSDKTKLDAITGTNTGDVTILDSASIDFSLSGQQISATVLPAGVDHNSLNNLTTGNPHTQYVQKAGDTMTGDLNFTAKGVNTADYVNYKNTYSKLGTEPIGSTYWDTANHTISTVLEDGVILQNGQEVHVYGKNISGSIIHNGDAVSIVQAGGSWTAFNLTDATNIASATAFIGLATHDIAINGFGYVTRLGVVRDLDTHLLTEGRAVYVDPSTPGHLTITFPATPNFIINVGVVEYQHATQGRINVASAVVPKLTILSDVKGVNFNTSGQFPVWDQTNKWFDATANINDYLTSSAASTTYLKLDASNDPITGQLSSNVATGTSPFSVASTTVNTNLNADLIDGQHASSFAPSSHDILSSTHGDTLTGSVAQGDIIIGNSTPKWSRLAKGTANAVLQSNATDVTWSTGFLSLTTGKTLTVNNTLTLSGTDSSTLNIGTGGTLGTAAYTASTAYDAAGAATSAVSTHASLQTGIHGISITSGKTFSSSNTLTLSGTDGSTLNIGTGGALGTAAYTASTAYDASGAATSAVSAHASLQTGVHGLAITAAKTITATDSVTIANSSMTLANTKVLTLTGSLTASADATVSNTNTGDVTLATNSGLAISSQVLNMGTPSSITSTSTNNVTTNTHAHAITASLGFIGNGTAQYQLPVTGATPFTPVWTTATGTGSPVLATTPTLVTPVIGEATGTSLDLTPPTGVVTTNFGIRIGTPANATNNYALQLSGTGGTAASGITFGTDTTLYRRTANVLKTDDSLDIALRLGVGATATANAGINNTYASTDPPTTSYGLFNSATYTLTAASGSRIVYGYYGNLVLTAGAGVVADNTVALASVVRNLFYSTTSHVVGYVAQVVGAVFGANNTSTGRAVEFYGVRIDSGVNSGGGTVDINYGLVISSQTVGTTNYSLYTNAGQVRFGDTTITSGRKQAIAIKSANYTLTAKDEVVVFTTTAIATLPAATGTGQTYRIVCRAGTLTVDANASETIKGELSQVLYAGEDLIITDTASGIWE